MKKVYAALLLLLILSYSLCTSCNVRGDNSVYICTGYSAYCYHCKRNCRGLNNCHADIKKVSLNVAKSKGREPCNICY